MRPEPKIAPPPVREQPRPDRLVQRRRYQLLTPLFGGGVSPGEVDTLDQTVIRGSEIRGQLRFWWRACRGGAFDGDLNAMKQREDELWGAASTEARPRPSQVNISVLVEAAGSEDRPYEVIDPGRDDRGRPRKPQVRPRRESTAPAYAAFPLQPPTEGAQPGMPTKAVRLGVCFTLEIAFPSEHRARGEVEAALWAWETFGGIGARTRRGFGALHLTDVDGIAPTLPADRGALRQQLLADTAKHVVAGRWPDGVPHLSAAQALTFRLTGPHGEALAAWTYLINKLKDFRQQRNGGAAPNRPGRSRWPEPDAIRQLTGQSAPRHSQPVLGVQKFPRAQFGLPVVTHFKDAGDPGDTILQADKYDRLASPLILRPLRCAAGAVGLALVLNTPRVPPGGLVLKGKAGMQPVRSDLTVDEAKQIVTASGKPLFPAGTTDPLGAFLSFIESGSEGG